MTVEAQPKLTPRELEVAALLAQDKRLRDIAGLMGISYGTLIDYADKIRMKLGCETSRGIAIWYFREFGENQ